MTSVSDPHIAVSPVCSTAPVLQVKPSHDAAAVDTRGSGAEERQTDTPAADSSRPFELSTKRISESDSSTATGECEFNLKKFLSQSILILNINSSYYKSCEMFALWLLNKCTCATSVLQDPCLYSLQLITEKV